MKENKVFRSPLGSHRRADSSYNNRRDRGDIAKPSQEQRRSNRGTTADMGPDLRVRSKRRQCRSSNTTAQRRLPKWTEEALKEELQVFRDVDILLLSWMRRMWIRHGVPYEVSLLGCQSCGDLLAAESWIISAWVAGQACEGAADSQMTRLMGSPDMELHHGDAEVERRGNTVSDEHGERRDSGGDETDCATSKACRNRRSVQGRSSSSSASRSDEATETSQAAGSGEGANICKDLPPFLTWKESARMLELIRAAKTVLDPKKREDSGRKDAEVTLLDTFGSDDDTAACLLDSPTGFRVTLKAIKAFAQLPKDVPEIILISPMPKWKGCDDTIVI